MPGRAAGIIGYQRSGEPGLDRDNTQFFIRGVTSFGYGSNNPLILIDGVELSIRDLARLQPDDIAEFSILKDASATAIYGARGANGVIFVTLKEGVEGPASFDVRIESSMSRSSKDIEFSDPVTYMKLHNEAVKTRDPLGLLPYSQDKIEKTADGSNPILYPATDWREALFKDNTINKRANLSANGGGSVARYYISTSFSQDNGVLNVPKLRNYNSNIKYNQFQLRSNTNIKLTKTTNLKMNFSGNFDDYNGPIFSGSDLYRNIVQTNPVYFKPYYEKDEEHQFTKHILFGNYDNGNGLFINPYADLAKGYKETIASKVIAQVELDQDLKSLIDGLHFKGIVNATRESGNSISRELKPYYYSPLLNRETGTIKLLPLNEETGTEFLNYSETGKYVISTTYLESRLNYSKEINDIYDVSGLLVFTANNRIISGAGNLQESLPFRNMGLAGRFSLGVLDKYLTEFTFGYNGSERFSKKHRWGYFPSLAFGWVVSNEKFFENLKESIGLLKLKASYGLVGNDNFGGERFYYLSLVNLNGGRGYTTGENYDNTLNGTSVSRYANEEITWETGAKFNTGIEITFLKDFNLEAEYYVEARSNIFLDRIVPSNLGLEAGVSANIGKAVTKGLDAVLNYNKSFNNDLWIQARGSFTFARNRIIKIEEPDYSATPWLSHVGKSIHQQWGYIAERLFVDENEVNNSPKQQFGPYSGGDIKYRDINGDGVISELDKVPIGNPTIPEINYGFGFSTGYKNFDLSCFFQGSTNSSFWVNQYYTAPFVNIVGDGRQGNNQLLKVWADDHWSEDNRNLYAKWPRLSSNIINNNNQRSTWFMHDGTFLKLKSLELGYKIPDKLVTRWGFQSIRAYASGLNLHTFSNFKLWDPEMADNGLAYPTQRVYNIGIQLSL